MSTSRTIAALLAVSALGAALLASGCAHPSEELRRKVDSESQGYLHTLAQDGTAVPAEWEIPDLADEQRAAYGKSGKVELKNVRLLRSDIRRPDIVKAPNGPFYEYENTYRVRLARAGKSEDIDVVVFGFVDFDVADDGFVTPMSVDRVE